MKEETMAIAFPSQPRKTNNRSREMQEIREPQEWQFTKETPKLEGVYLGAQKVTVKSTITTQHMIQDGEGHRFTFLGTYDLERKLSSWHVGHWMIVEFEGEDRNVRSHGSRVRRFRISVSKQKEPEFLDALALDWIREPEFLAALAEDVINEHGPF